ncbi:cytochrome P450 90A1-like [Chenopodium quinoa]|uniref:cytochrome P450 90A1-like n=1 Tax=Chenopodium quinoa TaxID=63459 RepID=UPI000B78D36E|nr:cytochrome P450 90A1-like [Chenopodium quinoa]
MEFSLNVTITLFISLLSLPFLLFTLYRRRPNTLPPGKMGLPFIGETLQLISAFKSDNPEPFTDERVGRFGPIFLTHLFGEPTIYSVDPEVNRFILNNEGKLFESSYPSIIAYLHGEYSLLLMKGNLHKKMHSLTVNFTKSALTRGRLLLDMDRLMLFCMDSWSPKLLLLEETKKVTFALTIKLLLSYDPCEWTENLRKEFLLIVEGFWSIPLPFFSISYKRAVKAKTKVVEALKLVVKERRSARDEGERKSDILGAILDEKADDEYSDEMIVDLLVSLMLAGFETTSSAMTLAVKFLTESPLALAQLKEEQEKIRDQKGDNELLVWNDYKSMSFTQCVISETLRISNIVGAIFRRTLSDIQMNGYTIPKGWKVLAAIRGVHMNDEYFKDAQSFNPWRWQGDAEMTPANVFIPFGGGPRLCPGYELSRVSISIFLHRLITKYSWEAAEEDKLVFFPLTGTQKRYPINVRPRNPSV